VPRVVPGLVRGWSESMVGALVPMLSPGYVETLVSPKSRIFAWTSACGKDIRTLDIAVDDSLGIRGVERVGDLNAPIEHHPDLQRLAVDSMAEGLPLQKLRRNEGSASTSSISWRVRMFGLFQGGRGLGFALETADGLRIVGKFVGKELESPRCRAKRSRTWGVRPTTGCSTVGAGGMYPIEDIQVKILPQRGL
jgi:hypothetical protein